MSRTMAQGQEHDPKFDILMKWLEQRTADTTEHATIVDKSNLKDIRCEMGPALTEEQFKAYCQKMGDKAPKIIKAPIQKPK